VPESRTKPGYRTLEERIYKRYRKGIETVFYSKKPGQFETV